MAVTGNVIVLGPYAPKQFEAGTVQALLATGMTSMTGTTIIAADPVLILGNYYIIVVTQ